MRPNSPLHLHHPSLHNFSPTKSTTNYQHRLTSPPLMLTYYHLTLHYGTNPLLFHSQRTPTSLPTAKPTSNSTKLYSWDSYSHSSGVSYATIRKISTLRRSKTRHHTDTNYNVFHPVQLICFLVGICRWTCVICGREERYLVEVEARLPLY